MYTCITKIRLHTGHTIPFTNYDLHALNQSQIPSNNAQADVSPERVANCKQNANARYDKT